MRQDLWKSVGTALAAFFSGAPEYQARWFDSGWSVSTGEPLVDFNCGGLYRPETADEDLKQIVGALDRRRVPFMISAAEGIDVHQIASGLGLSEGWAISLMSYQAQEIHKPEIPQGLTIFQVKDIKWLAACNDLATEIFALPPESVQKILVPSLLNRDDVKVYLSLCKDTPAGLTVLTFDENRVGIWCMGVASEFRRKGFGKSLLLSAMHLHHIPETTFFLFPTASGRPLYEHIGFVTASTGQAWIRSTPL
jgi:GNAT superfamily N-acetyltransferase